MRRMPPSWALLAVAAGLFTIAGTIFNSTAINHDAAWLLTGVSITLIGAWSAVEVHRAIRNDAMSSDEDNGDSPSKRQ